MGGAVRSAGRAIDPTTGRGLANLATGGLYEMNRQAIDRSGIGGGGKNGAPTPPDFVGAANDQTRANRPNQTNPFSSSTWSRDEAGNWTHDVSLTPGLQDAAQNIIGGLGSQLDPSAMRDQAIQSAYQQATSRLDPQWAQRMASADTQAINRGLAPGSRAYDSQMETLNQSRNDAYANALLNAQTGAGNAAFSQALAANQQPYQQLQALRGLTNQNSYGQAADLVSALGAQYGGQLNQYATDQAGKNSLLNGVAGLGGMAIAASDERLKDDIIRSTLEAAPGIPLATWRWKGDPSGQRHHGVIAQDVQRIRPDLVLADAEGTLYVDYGRLFHG